MNAPAQQRFALRSILAATDFSTVSRRALDYAVSFARRYRSDLYITHVLPIHEAVSEPLVECMPRPDARKQFASKLKRLAGYPQSENIHTETLLAQGSVGTQIRQQVTTYKVDLVFAGTHGRGESSTVGSVAEEIFREVPCPVLTVGPCVSRQPAFEICFRHILFATDFSPESAQAAPLAISLAEEYCCRLTLVHALDQDVAMATDFDQQAKKYEGRLLRLLSPEWRRSIRANFLVEAGSPGEVIKDFAKDNEVDLIVLGVKKSPKLEQPSFTRTAYNVVAHSDCPVLTVRGTRTRF